MRSNYQLLGAAAVGAAVLMLVALLLVGVLFLPVIGLGQAVPAEAQGPSTPVAQVAPTFERAITVVGEGKVRAMPDTAQANIGVEVIGREVAQATSDASDVMEQILTALRAEGIAENDIQTSYYNVWVERPYNPEGGQPGEPIYHVNNNVMVTIRDLSKVTTILGAAIEAGANNINGVNFSVSDPAELRSQARQEAIEDARATAEELAMLTGVEIGDVVSVSEVISSGAYYVSEQAAAAQGFGGGAGPISPGEVEVQVQLQVAYGIQ